MYDKLAYVYHQKSTKCPVFLAWILWEKTPLHLASSGGLKMCLMNLQNYPL